MTRLYDARWVAVGFVLTIIVAAFGYPAFERKYGFPSALFWTLGCIAGVWLTYLIRAFLWRGKSGER